MAKDPMLPGMATFLRQQKQKGKRFADPVPDLARGAKDYAERIGKTHNPEQFKDVGVGPGYHALFPVVRKQFEESPEELTPQMKESYDALRNETRQQYEYLTGHPDKGGLGFNVEVTDTDPYKSPEELRSDVLNNKRLRVLSTKSTGGHALFTDEENDMFRAVHDAFGHLSTGRNFTREGEEAAYGSHASMFTDKALPALVSETRAQNSYLINKGQFSPNRPVNVPEWATSLEGTPEKPKKQKVERPTRPTLFD